MLSRTILVFTAILFTTLSLQASAEDAAVPSSQKKNPWTECGLGAMIFANTPWAAAISNVIWDFGTTAVTSAFSSEHTCSGKRVVAALFINETYANIEEETANGSGEHISAMLNIMGCESAAHQDIVGELRNGLSASAMNASYSGKSVSDKAQDYYQTLDKVITTQYAQKCTSI